MRLQGQCIRKRVRCFFLALHLLPIPYQFPGRELGLEVCFAAVCCIAGRFFYLILNAYLCGDLNCYNRIICPSLARWAFFIPSKIFYLLCLLFRKSVFIFVGSIIKKAEIMTHSISHEYDEFLNPTMPGVEVHVVYKCESEITFDEYGDEESNRLISIAPQVNGQYTHFTAFPLESHGEQAKRFLALLRESARQALHAQLVREGINELGRPVQSFIE